MNPWLWRLPPYQEVTVLISSKKTHCLLTIYPFFVWMCSLWLPLKSEKFSVSNYWCLSQRARASVRLYGGTRGSQQSSNAKCVTQECTHPPRSYTYSWVFLNKGKHIVSLGYRFIPRWVYREKQKVLYTNRSYQEQVPRAQGLCNIGLFLVSIHLYFIATFESGPLNLVHSTSSNYWKKK